MASSVPSEAAFSSAGLTITKLRSRLKGAIVEALQILQGAYREDLFPKYPCMALEEELEQGEDDEDNSCLKAAKAVKPLDLDEDYF